MCGGSILLLLFFAAAAPAECSLQLELQAHTPGPETIPSTFQTIFSYTAALDGTNFSWAAQSWAGENGFEGNWDYYTFRLDVYLSGSPLAQSTGAVWPSMTAENIQWKANGTFFEGVYWGTGSSTACSVGSMPTLGQIASGSQFAWLTQEFDVRFVGNETISTQYVAGVLAAHYSSATSCQDIWLVTSAGLEPGSSISAPVLYTKAEWLPESYDCDASRTYKWEYAQFEQLSTFEAAQTSPVFLLPAQCYNGSHAPSPCPAQEGAIHDALALWLSVGCVLSSLAGMVGTVLWYRIGLRWSTFSPMSHAGGGVMPGLTRSLSLHGGAQAGGQQGVYQKLVDLI